MAALFRIAPLLWLCGVIAVTVLGIRNAQLRSQAPGLAIKPLWPFVLLTVLAWPAAVLSSFVLGWGLSFVISQLIVLGLVIGGVVGTSTRFRANARLRAATMPPTPAAPIGYTNEGQPIYPVVGYTPDGRPVTADRAVGMAVPGARTNSMAITSLICAFLMPLLGVIFGHVARSQIRRTGEQGAGMALAGLIIGYLSLAASVIFGIALVAAMQGSF